MTERSSLARLALAAAVGPVLLAANSPGEWQARDLLTLLAFTTALSIACSGLRRVLCRRLPPTTGLAVDLTWVAALTLPFLISRELGALLGDPIRLRTVLAVTGTVTFAGTFWILRRKTEPSRGPTMVTIAASALIVSSMLRIGWQVVQRNRALATSPTAQAVMQWDADSAARSVGTSARPDILILLLDAYAGDSLLRSDYQLEHREMRAAVAELGFSPSEGIRTNYAHTFASVPSLLNFMQVAPLRNEPIGTTQDAGFLYRLVRENRTAKLLAALGYELHWVQAPLFATRSLAPAGSMRHMSGRPMEQLWLYAPLVHTWLSEVFTLEVLLHAAGRHDFDLTPPRDAALETLREIVGDGRPSFAFGHLMSTHRPFMYDPDCQANPAAERDHPLDAAYRAAVTCLDQALLPAFRATIAAARGNVVIIAVGDHAPGPVHGGEGDGPAETVPRSVAAGRFDATAFIYLPPDLRQRFEQPATEVNLLPAVLNLVFGTAIPAQPDSSYYSRGLPHHLYRFVPLSALR